MGSFIVFLCSGLCLLIYLPVIGLGINQIRSRRATFTLGAAVNRRIYRFTDTAAVLFGIGQLLSGTASVVGVMLALRYTNLLFLLIGILAGGLLAMGALWLARRTQSGEYAFDVSQMGPQITFTQSGFTFNRNMQGQSNETDEDVVVMDSEDAVEDDARPNFPSDDDIIEGDYTPVEPDDEEDDDRDSPRA